jgi:MFS family permease
VLLIGVASLFADVSYKGARSITGASLAYLGASAFVIGLVAGVGKVVGYALRIVFGYLSDRTGRYWLEGHPGGRWPPRTLRTSSRWWLWYRPFRPLDPERRF